MNRTPKLFLIVGVFLVVSILWPYEPAGSRGRADVAPVFAFTFPVRDPAPTLRFPDDWQGRSQEQILSDSIHIVGGATVAVEVPPGHRILPGTDHLLVRSLISGVSASSPGVELGMVTANDITRSVPLTGDGQSASIVVDETMNDWSPDANTRWHFTVSSRSYDPIEVQLSIDIVRGPGALPGDIGYSDAWGHAHAVRIFDERGTLLDARAAPLPSGAGIAGGPAVSMLEPTEAPTIKQMPTRDAASVVVVLAYNSSTPPDLHYRPLLSYRGADKGSQDWEVRDASPAVVVRDQHNGRFEWRLPVEPRMWDSPFATKTRWAIIVNWRGDSTQPPVMMDGDYHFWIVANKVPDL